MNNSYKELSIIFFILWVTIYFFSFAFQISVTQNSYRITQTYLTSINFICLQLAHLGTSLLPYHRLVSTVNHFHIPETAFRQSFNCLISNLHWIILTCEPPKYISYIFGRFALTRYRTPFSPILETDIFLSCYQPPFTNSLHPESPILFQP